MRSVRWRQAEVRGAAFGAGKGVDTLKELFNEHSEPVASRLPVMLLLRWLDPPAR